MRTFLPRVSLRTLAPLALLVAVSCGGGGTPEERALSTLEEVVTVLEGVESADDVEAATAKLEALGEEMKAIEDETGGGEPDFTEAQQEQFADLMKRMMNEMPRLAGIEGSDALMQAMEPSDSSE